MFVYLTHLICFILLVAVAFFAFCPRFRPMGIDLTAAAVALIGVAYTVALAVARVLICAAIILWATGCTQFRNDVESVDFKAGYGGAYVGAGAHLRDPAAGYRK